ncbi:MAG: RNA polymerase sigma factor [Acholeplasmataceae bacterium]
MVTLKQMIRQFKQKDYQSFDIFYNQTKQKVFFAVINIIKDESLVDDVMQETYLKFLKNIDKVKSDGNVSAYLQRIARNLAIDLYNQRKKEVYGNEIFETIPAEEEKHQEDIFEILDMLESDEKEVVSLHIINDLKFREIADMMDKPLGTVLWLYQKALKKLKEKVGDYI